MMNYSIKFLACTLIILSSVLISCDAGMPNWVETNQTADYTIYHDANNIKLNDKSQYITLSLKAQSNINPEVFVISKILINCNSSIIYKQLSDGQTIGLQFTDHYNQMCLDNFDNNANAVISPENNLNDIFDA